MAPESEPKILGVSQAPDLDPDSLQQVESIDFVPRLELDGVWISSLSLHGAEAGSLRLERVRLEDVDLGESKLRGLRILDAMASGIAAANGDWGGAELRRVTVEGGRLTGLNLGEARLEEVEFRNCKLDYANFRHSTIDHVSFEDCVLAEADFQGSAIKASRFASCSLSGADFSQAELAWVDMSGSDLDIAGSAAGLRGAIVDPSQLIDLAPRLAQALGITVRTPGPGQ